MNELGTLHMTDEQFHNDVFYFRASVQLNPETSRFYSDVSSAIPQ